MKVYDTETFKARALEVHGLRYTYDKSIYTKSNAKVTITCNVHGDFEQLANNHLSGQGCKDCNIVRYTTESYIEKAQSVHGLLYDYSLTVYSGASKDLIIICALHGEFTKKAYAHLEGAKCPTCAKIEAAKTRRQKKHF